MNTSKADVLVVGGGIVGLATALAVVEEHGGSATVLEAESALGRHQSGRNSGVIHSGLYYAPGSARALLCVDGRLRMEAFCAEEGVPRLAIGKLVVATDESELPALDELERRGRANGLTGLERLDGAAVSTHEPLIRAVQALWVPETSVTDFRLVVQALARRLEWAGGTIRPGQRVVALVQDSAGVHATTAAQQYSAGAAVVCGGLQADRLARLASPDSCTGVAGAGSPVSIVPFRGVYRALGPRFAGGVRSLVYPVPDARFPFLGIHLTPTLDGRLLAGPTAVPCLARDADSNFAVRDAWALLRSPGWWRLARRSWRFGAGQIRLSSSSAAFARELQKLLPDVTAEDLSSAPGGVRAQAVTREGQLVDDFLTLTDGRVIHVLNAPSPAATAALAIGRQLAAEAVARL